MSVRHFISALFISLLTCGSASAIILSLDGDVNLTIPITSDGVYLNFTDLNDASAYTVSSSDPGDGNWDINLFYGGAAVATSDTFLPVVSDADTQISALLNLSEGTIVGPSDGFDYATDYNGSSGHMGSESLQFVSGTSGCIAFVLNFEGDLNNYYGWMMLTLNDDGSSGTIHTWAWETSGGSIEVGVVPEPCNSALFFGMGVVFFFCSRRGWV
jgi:hypothetical protein